LSTRRGHPYAKHSRNKLTKSLDIAKTCRKCGKEKQRSAFPSNPRTRDRLSSWCRPCHALACRRWREKDRAAAIEEFHRRQEADNKRLREQWRAHQERIAGRRLPAVG
jgi:hypothetical protein